MSRKTILMVTTLLAITLALSMVVASAQAQDPVLILQLKYRNGTDLKPLVNEYVTVQLNGTTMYEGKTDSTGNVTITLPAGSNRANVTVWWKASWGVSYLVNFTGTTLFSTLNKSVINCSIYNVNLWTVDQGPSLGRCDMPSSKSWTSTRAS
jgi:hypothetical protein